MKTFVKCLSLAILLVTSVISCTKDNGNPNDPVCRVNSIKWDTMETRMKYDAAGNVLKATDLDSSKERWSASFEYSTGKIIEKDSAASAGSDFIDLASVTITHIVGANGFVSVSYFGGPGTWVEDSTWYTYNSEGYLTKSVHTHYQIYNNGSLHQSYIETHNYTIANGNRVAETINWVGDGTSNPNYTNTVAYTYYSAQSNYNGININYYYDYPFLGKKNVSLLKKAVYTYGLSGTTDSYEYTYEFDTTGKPIKVTNTSGTGSGSEVFRLGYACQ
jgi:YD repeat-containing protein